MERRPKILLADDDPDLLEMYREVLAQLPSQPEIHTAISGAREDFAGGRRSRLAGDVPGSPGAVAQPARDPYRHLRRARRFCWRTTIPTCWRCTGKSWRSCPASPRSIPPSPARAKILLADDDPDLLEMYREVLAQLPSQPEIHTAISGARVIAMLEAEPFQLLICDLKMPKMDGLQVLAIVRRTYPQLRTVALTAEVDEQFRSRAYALGVD